MAPRAFLVTQITIYLLKYSGSQEISSANNKVIYSLIIYDKESSKIKEKVHFI